MPNGSGRALPLGFSPRRGNPSENFPMKKPITLSRRQRIANLDAMGAVLGQRIIASLPPRTRDKLARNVQRHLGKRRADCFTLIDAALRVRAAMFDSLPN